MRTLSLLFQVADNDHGGAVTLTEFKKWLNSNGGRMKHSMAAVEVDVSDIDTMFALMDNGDGKITLDEFIYGVMKLRGPSKKMDVVNLLNITKAIQDELGDLKMLMSGQ